MNVRVPIPMHLMDKIEALRKEWGLQSRGTVIARLLEVVLEKE
tara:strand:- start:215 stop:343 length:129 start_codon:yes stop_codon:yes gene_type:complete